MRSTFLLMALLFMMMSPSVAQLSAEGKNMVKVNVSAFAFKGFHFQAERKIAGKWTVALGYGSVPKSTLAFQSYLQKQIDNPNVDISAFKLGTSVITPEIRFYPGKRGAFHGIYFAPYGRIGKYAVEGPVSYHSTLGGTRSALFIGNLSTLSGGVMVGGSWRLAGRLYLDVWLIGVSYGSANGHLTAQTQLNPAEQQSLRNELDKISIPLTEIEYEVNSNGAIVNTKGGMVGLRGLGFNLGFRF